MPDSLTVAFEIRRPWPATRDERGWRYWPAWVTIWHCDPERHGADDSCGWSFVRLTQEDSAWAEKYAQREWEINFAAKYCTVNLHFAGNLETLAFAWAIARRRERRVYVWKPLSPKDLCKVVEVLANAADNLQGACRAARETVDGFATLLSLTLRIYRTFSRPWYRHPRWHLHHWDIRIEPMQDVKRWLFSRCLECGKGFKYGETPCGPWAGNGPQWWFGKEQCWHMRCAKTPNN